MATTTFDNIYTKHSLNLNNLDKEPPISWVYLVMSLYTFSSGWLNELYRIHYTTQSTMIYRYFIESHARFNRISIVRDLLLLLLLLCYYTFRLVNSSFHFKRLISFTHSVLCSTFYVMKTTENINTKILILQKKKLAGYKWWWIFSPTIDFRSYFSPKTKFLFALFVEWNGCVCIITRVFFFGFFVLSVFSHLHFAFIPRERANKFTWVMTLNTLYMKWKRIP